MNVEEIICEGLRVHYPNISIENRITKLKNVLNKVGLNYSECMKNTLMSFLEVKDKGLQLQEQYLNQNSNFDEPTSALDITIQNQIINLLNKLQK